MKKAELNQALADAENDYSDQPDIDDENSAAASFDDSSDFIVIDDKNSAADSGPDKADDSEADNDPEKNS